MIESRLGIDLGRTPVKDAAGPNDFKHLKKVEHRAKMTNAFDFMDLLGQPRAAAEPASESRKAG